MIDFACKKFNLDEIIKCSLSLSKSDFIILEFFMKNKNEKFKTDQISKQLGLDKSTVQRAVKKLREKGLLFRSQFNLSSGGYVFVYQIKSKEKIRGIILDIIHLWVKNVEESLRKF